ncbi:GGDEF domain-containing protein [Desulfosarcina ovata]|nr:GGDEF domain-containing protein [Desulfosarcina ovata]
MKKSTESESMQMPDRPDHAFQPIVNIHSGVCYGYEATIINADAKSVAGPSGQDCRDSLCARTHGGLYQHAVTKFNAIPWNAQACLFFNIDSWLYDETNGMDGLIDALAKEPPGSAGKRCLQLSARLMTSPSGKLIERLNQLRRQGVRIAVDGFGGSGMRLFYDLRPDYVKLDPFFIDQMDCNREKRMIAACLVSVAHQLGSMVIAQRVADESVFHECRNIGCDLVQGDLIQPSMTDPQRLRKTYSAVRQWCEHDRRGSGLKDHSLLRAGIETIHPVRSDAPMTEILDAFKNHITRTFFPVVNPYSEPVGIIRETSIKEFIYSRYGRFVLENQAFSRNIDEFITRIPQVDVRMPIDHIMDLFTGNEPLEGVLVTRDMAYVGFLNTQSMLKILNEKKLALARDQNPLSNLPGNHCIVEYVSQALQDTAASYALVYFDFDNFKAYNDHYGFRQGDRVILLFADLLKSHILCRDRFVGHVGGDDFFMGLKDIPLGEVVDEVTAIASRFRDNVRGFYRHTAIERGCIQALDREGQLKCFPLMTVSSVILDLPADGQRIYSPEEIGTVIAKMKKTAKQSADKLSVASLMPRWDSEAVS